MGNSSFQYTAFQSCVDGINMRVGSIELAVCVAINLFNLAVFFIIPPGIKSKILRLSTENISKNMQLFSGVMHQRFPGRAETESQNGIIVLHIEDTEIYRGFYEFRNVGIPL